MSATLGLMTINTMAVASLEGVARFLENVTVAWSWGYWGSQAAWRKHIEGPAIVGEIFHSLGVIRFLSTAVDSTV